MRKINLSPILLCFLLLIVSIKHASATDPLIPLSDTSCVLNLDALMNGAIVSEQYAAAGIHISATAYGGNPNVPIIFDTDLSGTPDPDIELGIGNVLIMPENVIDANNDNLVDVPDKSIEGGIFYFDFDEDFVIYSIVLVDVDNLPIPPPIITTFDSAGNVLSNFTGIPAGNGSIQTLLINTAGVRTLKINFPGSGAITNLIIGCGTIPLEVSVNADTVECFDGTDGQLCATAANGTPPYTYQWDINAAGQTSACANGLAAGSYSVTVTDGLGLTAAATGLVSQPSQLVLNLDSANLNCSGDTTGSLTASVSDGTPPYSYSWSSNAGGQTTATIYNLGAGIYEVTVSDANGCLIEGSSVVIAPDQLVASLIGVDATCPERCDGELTLSATGGVPPYTYVSNGGLTGTFTNPISGDQICDGSYAVIVTDQNGCVSVDSATISEADSVTGIFTVSPVSCYNACDGEVTMEIIGGSGTYGFKLADGQIYTYTGPVLATGLCSGTYLVTVSDDNLCYRRTSVTVPQPPPLLLSLTATNNACFGDCNGTATAHVTGGNGGETYLWEDGQTTPTATGLCAGTYTVTVKDSNHCTAVDSITITEGPELVASAAANPLNSCPFDPISLTGSPSGGTPPYTHFWTASGGSFNDPNIQNPVYMMGMAGNHTLVYTVTDSAGCMDSDTITVMIINCSSIGDYVWCDDNGDGIQDSNEAPIAGVVIELLDDMGNVIGTMTTDANGAYDFTNLPPGTYTVNVVDSTVPDGKQLTTGNDPLVVNLGPGQDFNDADFGYQYTGSIGDYVWCDDNGDGIQDPNEDPIAGVLIYLLDDMGNIIDSMTTDANGAYDFTNLPPGMYTVDVNDATVPAGKDLTTGNDPLVVNLGPGQDFNGADFGYQYTGSIGDYVWCDDNGDGIQDPNEDPIAGVLIYLLDDMGNIIDSMTTDANGAYDFTNLPPGMYTVDVNDATVPAGKDLTTGNDPLVVNLGPGQDFNDADFGYQYTGSIGDYVWCDDNGDGIQDSNEAPIAGVVIELLDNMGNVIATMTTDANGAYDFTNLPPGTYMVNVVDSTVPDGKVLTTGNDPLTVNLGPGEDFNDADFGYNCIPPTLILVANAISCNGANDGSIDLILMGGTGTNFTFEWSNLDTTQNIDGLAPGQYSVIVTDQNGCSATGLDSIIQPDPLTTSVMSTDVTCNGFCDGTATVTADGGVGGYSYLWSDSQSNQTAIGLCAGTYSVIVKDSNECAAVDSIVITELEELDLVLTGSIMPGCFGFSDGEATVSAQGGTEEYTYLWNDPLNQTTPTATGLMGGIYEVIVTDTNNCADTLEFELDQPKEFGLSISGALVTCDTVCDAVAVIASVGGSGNNNTYLWDDPNGQTSGIATGLCPGTYTVIATDVANCTATASVTIGNSCKTGDTQVENDKPLEFTQSGNNIDVYPNPASSAARIDFSSPHGGTLSIEIFDITGQLIQSIYQGRIENGKKMSLDVQTNQISDGVYFVRFIGSEGLNEVKRLIISK